MARAKAVFQSSPNPRVGRSRALSDVLLAPLVVSILAQPKGRAQPPNRPPRARLMFCFNPRPTQGSGAAASVDDTWLQVHRFNPRPTQGSGAALKAGVILHARGIVSILAQPKGRAQRGSPPRTGAGTRGFNPRPTQGSGAAAHVFGKCNPQSRFNPRPTQGSGAARRSAERDDRDNGFNPRPTQGSGAAPQIMELYDSGVTFQSSPNPRVGRSPARARKTLRLMLFQSSPNPRVGRSGNALDAELAS